MLKDCLLSAVNRRDRKLASRTEVRVHSLTDSCTSATRVVASQQCHEIGFCTSRQAQPRGSVRLGEGLARDRS